MVTCYLGIGSNLGDRRENIKLAIKEIKALKGTRLIKTSKVIETAPQGGPAGQPRFLNGAVKITTNIPPAQLLKKLKNIEHKLGRTKSVRNGPRAIDLDILFYGDNLVNTRRLQIPHPRIFEREFVLKPLKEVI